VKEIRLDPSAGAVATSPPSEVIWQAQAQRGD
jgi:hypothetical protein